MKDLSQIDDYLSINEIKQLIDEFIGFYQNPTDKNLVYAFDQLCELAERQWHTYEILEKKYQDKITEFIIKNINFNDYDVMDAVTFIIPNFGLENAFHFILQNRYKIKNQEIIKILDECIKEYGETVADPYSGMRH